MTDEDLKELAKEFILGQVQDISIVQIEEYFGSHLSEDEVEDVFDFIGKFDVWVKW